MDGEIDGVDCKICLDQDQECKEEGYESESMEWSVRYTWINIERATERALGSGDYSILSGILRVLRLMERLYDQNVVVLRGNLSRLWKIWSKSGRISNFKFSGKSGEKLDN